MHRILLIEDDSFKAINIREYILELMPDSSFDEIPSLVEAIDFINKNTYDLVLVDMAIPSHPSLQGEGSPMSFLNGGLEILLELKSLDRKDPCIVITQFHEIEISSVHYAVKDAADAIKKEIDCDILGCIEYSEESERWKADLSKFIKKNENPNT
ncbi:response regulator [Bordetella tumulicola]|uniref:response regulator n=1 Tax=Bordetella tumulicola TaxID=1649133 RepID=UPI0039EE3021